MKRKNVLIGVYVDDDSRLPVTIVDTIEEASKFIGCAVSTLYRNLKIDGEMNARGYIVEIIKTDDES